jgi:signal transduction histidine kinase
MSTGDTAAGRDARDPGRGVLVVAAVVAVLALPMTAVTLHYGAPHPAESGLAAWVIGLSALLHAIAFLCRRAPVIAFLAGSAVMLTLAVTMIPGLSSAAMMPSSVAYLLLVWQLAAGGEPLRSFGALAVGITGAGLIVTAEALWGEVREPLLLLVETGALVAGVVAAWALGALSRQRRLAEEQRARERTRRALTEERTRIGRDLHDIVSHSLTVMVAQAEAARVIAAEQAADEAMERVAETGRSAMQGLRGMLRVLDDGGSPPLEPMQGIDGIPALAESARSAEHVIRFVARGQARPLAPDAGIAAYRMAQEALTNAIRHVRAPVRIDIDVEWGEGEVTVTVTDDGGRGPVAPSGAGQEGGGLIGMAERVERAGGTLDIRRGDRGDGWRVRAALPAEGES